MSPALQVSFTPRAYRQIADAKRWWRQNRTKAPRALELELEIALETISDQPEIGARARNLRLPGIRRLFLSRIRYYLYYRHRSEPTQSLEIVAFWHASRGSGPRL